LSWMPAAMEAYRPVVPQIEFLIGAPVASFTANA
jgi:hypothetical protein